MRLPYSEFKKIYSKVPRVTIEVLLATDKGVVLSLRDIHPYKGMWHVPGGTLLYEESVEDAVDRISKGELGVSVIIEKFLGYWVIPEWEGGGFSHAVGLIHKVRIKSGKLRGSSQGSKLEVFSEIPENMIPQQRDRLKKLIKSF